MLNEQCNQASFVVFPPTLFIELWKIKIATANRPITNSKRKSRTFNRAHIDPSTARCVPIAVRDCTKRDASAGLLAATS